MLLHQVVFGCCCKSALWASPCDSENMVRLGLYSWGVFALKNNMPPIFLHVRSFWHDQNFCSIIHLEEKLGRYFATPNTLTYTLFSIQKRMFCSFLYCNEGRKRGFNREVILNAYITECCCIHQTNVPQVYSFGFPHCHLCGLGKLRECELLSFRQPSVTVIFFHSVV